MNLTLMYVNLVKNSFSNCTHIVIVYTLWYWQGVIIYIKIVLLKKICIVINLMKSTLYLYYQFANNYNYSHLIRRKMSVVLKIQSSPNMWKNLCLMSSVIFPDSLWFSRRFFWLTSLSAFGYPSPSPVNQKHVC